MSRIYFMDGLESLPFSHTEKLTLWFKNRTTISSLELLWRNFELNYPFFVTLILFIDIIGPPFMKALLRSCHRISVNLNSRLRLGLYSTLILTFFSKYVVDCPVCLGSLSSCMTQVQLSFGYQTASNVMSSVWQQKLSWNWVYKGNLWLTQWYQGAQVLWQQNKPKPSHLHHCVGSWNKVGVFFLICWLIVPVIGIMAKYLNFGVVCRRGHCSRSLVVRSDTTLQPWAVLLSFFWVNRLSLGNPSEQAILVQFFFCLFLIRF